MSDVALSLPGHIRSARRALRLSVRRAARDAGTSPAGWRAWEQGTRRPQDRRWPAIETVLQWGPGSVERVLAGGEPTPADLPPEPTYIDPANGEEYLDPDERALWDLRHDLGRRYVAGHGEARAAELGAERARELIAYLRARTAMDPPTNPRPAQVA